MPRPPQFEPADANSRLKKIDDSAFNWDLLRGERRFDAFNRENGVVAGDI